MNRFLVIALGAALGANARYFVGQWAGERFGSAYPYGTFLVNVTGSLVLGFLLTLGMGKINLSPELRLFLAVGFLGSYTTFSSYAVESFALFQGGSPWGALINVAGNNLVGLICALLGVYLAKVVG
ncbi:MAG: fluoride efflux transporter CrcB [Caldilineaceae bacterium]|nr:fluoride efflux transporter CrcB [Caldilineaceae bacterium]MBP8107945.1 fluoride efflux transporter CrcB [Caldilineaceae bacterium]MBP8122987.1 fluoride efflux transporter CrcB [Caldilineaceae bacterium]MBP9073018.1 fluoride efflux transporter CrcB [Caldilineaceae bacterium]